MTFKKRHFVGSERKPHSPLTLRISTCIATPQRMVMTWIFRFKKGKEKVVADFFGLSQALFKGEIFECPLNVQSLFMSRCPCPGGMGEVRTAGWRREVLGSGYGSACYLPLRFCSTPYTSSSLLSPSKTGSRSRSSVSFMSSNHDCTGTAFSGWKM